MDNLTRFNRKRKDMQNYRNVKEHIWIYFLIDGLI